MRWLPKIAALLAIAALALGGYFFDTDRPPPVPPPFVIAETEFNFEDLPLGEHEFVVLITNPANVPRRILGLAEG